MYVRYIENGGGFHVFTLHIKTENTRHEHESCTKVWYCRVPIRFRHQQSKRRREPARTSSISRRSSHDLPLPCSPTVHPPQMDPSLHISPLIQTAIGASTSLPRPAQPWPMRGLRSLLSE